MTDVRLQQLTPMLRRLTRSIGMGATLQLLRWKGGCRLCLPHDPTRSELSEYLSIAQVRALIDAFGAGMWITLPKVDKLYIAARNNEIRAAHDDGDSLATLAMRYGLSSRHIQNIVSNDADDASNDAGVNAKQQELF
ncbi:MAG TPA: Mor transcription activator family protein [Oleiagrimonas sp.]|nr:Mor transcription activator family protein [Oleiagrimonas sp.]